jgi:hypothetical protein
MMTHLIAIFCIICSHSDRVSWPCRGDLGDGPWVGVQWRAAQMWRMSELLLVLPMRLLVHSMATPQSVLRSTG